MDAVLRRDTISEKSAQCLHGLQACVRLPSLMQREWAENRLADFRLWTANIGAFARDRASLDMRLDTEQETKTLVVKILTLLHGCVETCLRLAGEDGRNDDQDSKMVTAEPATTADKLSPEPVPRSFSPWSDMSFTSSDSNQDTAPPSSTKLEQAQLEVDQILDHLVRVGIAIRKSGSNARSQKADRLFNADDHSELFRYLAVIILSRGSKDARDFDLVRPGLLSSVQERLVKANLRRRNRFLYAQRHALKLGGYPPEERRPMAPTVAQDGLSAVQQPTNNPKDGHTLAQLERKEVGEEEAQLANKSRRENLPLTDTSASAVGTTIREVPPILASSQMAKTNITTTAAKVVYPRPPQLREGMRFFKCPCCCQTLSSLYQRSSHWKKHLMEDIAPYTCIIEDCPKPDVIYTHRHDWEQHVERDHSSCWECVPCKTPGHAPVLFVSADDLVSHTAQLHNDSIEESQYTTLLASSRRVAPSGISQCPLCDETGEGDGDALFNHIAEHVHLFSLHSLPWLKDDDADIVDDDPYDYFQHNDYFHLGSSMRSSEYIQFSDPDEDSSEHNSNRSAVKDEEDPPQSIEDRPYSNAPRTTGLTASTLISLENMVDNGGESNKILSQWLKGHREAEDLEETPLDTERRDNNPEADPRLVMPMDNTDQPLASTVPSSSTITLSAPVLTGKPTPQPLQRPSTQLTMCRLYLYTTLSVGEIVDITNPPGKPGLGKDGATKILVMLLDKQPRWLRPRDVEDSVRRLSQLDWLSTLMEFISDPTRATPPPLSLPSKEGYRSADEPTTKTGEILSKYPESYANLVGIFINGFSAPVGLFAGNQSASVQEAMGEPPRLEDRQPADLFDRKPYPLPGDFLRLDSSEMCDHGSEGHRRRWCLCIARTELFNALFITPAGLTSLGHRLIDCAPSSPEECRLQDAFGNTLLHLLAARGNTDGLSFYLQQEVVSRIINYQNSSGQTFLHVLDLEQVHPDTLSGILDWLIMTEYLDGSKFDFSSCDHYGRSLFHVFTAVVEQSAAGPILERYSPILLDQRDAFNMRPTPRRQILFDPAFQPIPEAAQHSQPTPEAAQHFAIVREVRHIRLIQHATDFPLFEDEQGRNGLHLLASVILSKGSMESQTRLDSQRVPSSRRDQVDTEPPDSSHDRMRLRLSLAENLLHSGLDPNHYDCQGNTPLMAFAAQLPEDDDYKTGPQILDLLIKHGANVHWRNRSGETALLVAARCGKKLAVRTLIENGANVHVRDASGRGVLALLDDKMASESHNPIQYAHYEACRAYLSGSRGNACLEPTLMQEWGLDPSQVEGA